MVLKTSIIVLAAVVRMVKVSGFKSYYVITRYLTRRWNGFVII
jgi:hypothetical protein